MTDQEIHDRAIWIVNMVQGTMALEGQGITDQSFLDKLVRSVEDDIRSKIAQDAPGSTI